MKILNETKAEAIRNYRNFIKEITGQYEKIEKYEEIRENTHYNEPAWKEAVEQRDKLIIEDDELFTYWVFKSLENYEFWYTLDPDDYGFRDYIERYKENKNFEYIINRVCDIITKYVLYKDEQDYYEED